MSRTRYDNMTGGLTLAECGRALGLALPADIRAVLDQAKFKPCGGTTASPRFNARHVHELAAIRGTRRAAPAEQGEQR